jgi:hypothetical protein
MVTEVPVVTAAPGESAPQDHSSRSLERFGSPVNRNRPTIIKVDLSGGI